MKSYELWIRAIVGICVRKLGVIYTPKLGEELTSKLTDRLESGFREFRMGFERVTDLRARAWLSHCMRLSQELTDRDAVSSSSAHRSVYGSWYFDKHSGSYPQECDFLADQVLQCVAHLTVLCSDVVGHIGEADFSYNLTIAIRQRLEDQQRDVVRQVRQAFFDYVKGRPNNWTLGLIGVYPPPTGCEFGEWIYTKPADIQNSTAQDETVQKLHSFRRCRQIDVKPHQVCSLKTVDKERAALVQVPRIAMFNFNYPEGYVKTHQDFAMESVSVEFELVHRAAQESHGYQCYQSQVDDLGFGLSV